MTNYYTAVDNLTRIAGCVTQIGSAEHFKQQIMLKRRERYLYDSQLYLAVNSQRVEEQIKEQSYELADSVVRDDLRRHLSQLVDDVRKRDKLIELQSGYIAYFEHVVEKMEYSAALREYRVVYLSAQLREASVALARANEEKYSFETRCNALEGDLQAYMVYNARVAQEATEARDRAQMRQLVCKNCAVLRARVAELEHVATEKTCTNSAAVDEELHMSNSRANALEKQNEAQKLQIADLSSIIMQLKNEIKALRTNKQRAETARETAAKDADIENLRLKERIIGLETASKDAQYLQTYIAALTYEKAQLTLHCDELQKQVDALTADVYNAELRVSVYQNSHQQLAQLLEQQGSLISSYLRQNVELLK